jgi:hypothetical protein
MDNIYEIIDEETGAVLHSGSKYGMNIVTPRDYEVVEVSVTTTPQGSREPIHYYHRLVLRFSLALKNARILEEQAEEARLQAIVDDLANTKMKVLWMNHLAATYGERIAKYQVTLSKTPVKELKLLAKMDKFVLPLKGNKGIIVDAMSIQMVGRDDMNKLKFIDRNSPLPVTDVVDMKGRVADRVIVSTLPAGDKKDIQNVHSASSSTDDTVAPLEDTPILADDTKGDA